MNLDTVVVNQASRNKETMKLRKWTNKGGECALAKKLILRCIFGFIIYISVWELSRIGLYLSLYLKLQSGCQC